MHFLNSEIQFILHVLASFTLSSETCTRAPATSPLGKNGRFLLNMRLSGLHT